MKNSNALVLFIWMLCSTNLTAQSPQFSKEEIISDLEYLKKELELNHPNLYTYSSKEIISKWFKSQISNVSDSTSEKDAFKLITSFSSLLKDGHSYIYPSSKHLDDFFNSALLFPLDVFLMDDKLIVVRNFSTEQNIPLGSTLVEINGVKVEDIQTEIVQHTGRDGNNEEYPKHLYYKFFPAYYSYFYGFQDRYTITYQDKLRMLKSMNIKGLTRNEIKTKRDPKQGHGIELQIIPNHKSAIISIKSFDKSILKNDYNQIFKNEIKKIFRIIEEQNIQHIAIDLRDNQGGALSNGVFLLQHFMNSPFQCVSSYYILKNGKRKQLTTKWDKFFDPNKKHHFNGDVYLFMGLC